ncbi:MAG: SRPBCC family protein [Opitutales bacterium]
MEHVLQRECFLPYPREQVFPFFADAGNLERITPPSLNFHILTPQPFEMKTGALIDYKLRINGIPARWRTRISEWNPPFSFTDEQLKGPYKQWIHTHTFEERDGGTLMTDHVRYKLPFYPFGQIALPFVRRQVEGIFTHRNQVIPEILAEFLDQSPAPEKATA